MVLQWIPSYKPYKHKTVFGTYKLIQVFKEATISFREAEIDRLDITQKHFRSISNFKKDFDIGIYNY